MTKEVLLIEQVDGLGIEGDIVKVSDGYARNYLLPKGYASEVTEGLRRKVEKKRRNSCATTTIKNHDTCFRYRYAKRYRSGFRNYFE